MLDCTSIISRDLSNFIRSWLGDDCQIFINSSSIILLHLYTLTIHFDSLDLHRHIVFDRPVISDISLYDNSSKVECCHCLVCIVQLF